MSMLFLVRFVLCIAYVEHEVNVGLDNPSGHLLDFDDAGDALEPSLGRPWELQTGQSQFLARHIVRNLWLQALLYLPALV